MPFANSLSSAGLEGVDAAEAQTTLGLLKLPFALPGRRALVQEAAE
jgi:hypothetical protein